MAARSISGRLLLVWLLASTGWGQRILDNNTHLWLTYAGDHRINGPWSAIIEVQIRRADFGAIEQQYQSRNAMAYRLSPNAQVALGYVLTHTGQYGDVPAARPFKEHRVYQQLVFKHALRELEFEHRFRNEFRWVQTYTGPGDAYLWLYQNRVRYQVKLSHPFKGSWYGFALDEIFIPYGANRVQNSIDQNRAFAGVGYKVTPRSRLEVGYMNQFLIQRNRHVAESNHTLRVQWSSSVPFKRTR